MRRTFRLLPSAVLFAAAVAVGQQPQTFYPQPRVHSVFPAGGKAGTAVTVAILGTDLDDATGLIFTHPGLTANPPPVPPDPPADPKKKDPPKPAMKKALPPTEAKFVVAIAAGVPPGAYDVRVVNKWGVSNPRLFTVGILPEVNEKEPNNDVPEAQKVELGMVINGVLAGGTDVDYTLFAGKKGQRVLAHCATGTLDSKARPLVEVFTPDGRRLGGNRNYQGTDALADVTLPADGDYLVRVCEFAYQQGGPDYFYRLTLSTGPWVDAAFPLVLEAGKPTQVTLFGRNLPGGKPAAGANSDAVALETVTVTITPPAAPTFAGRGSVPPATGLLDAFEYRFPGANPVTLFTTTLPVVLEKAANDTPETAEAVPVPCEISGRIEKRYDRDWFAFPAKKGEVLYLELMSDRLGTNTDTFLVVRNPANGQEMAGEAQLDDDADPLHPTVFFSRSADPVAYKFTAPADGVYQVMVGSREANVSYGPRSGYRLRISPPRPDFRAVVMPRSRELPAAVTAHSEGEVAFDVFVQRSDGFNGPVTLTAAGLPAGVTATPATVGTGQRWGTLVLSGGPGLKDGVSDITVTATAVIDGNPAARPARPATIVWGIPGQQNVPTVTRMDQSLPVAVRGDKSSFRLATDLAAATVKSADGKDQKLTQPAVVKPGDKITVPVKVLWQEKEARAVPVQLAAELTTVGNAATLVTVNNNQPLPVPKEKADVPIIIDVKANATPGVYAVTVRGDAVVKFGKDAAGKGGRDVTVYGFAPAVEFLVLPAALGKLTVTPAAAVKQANSADVTVKIERLFDFAGEFKVSFTLPKEAAGLTLADVTVPAGANEVKAKLVAAKDAKIGAVNNVLVKAVAAYEGKHAVTHEAKFNVTVSKEK